MKNIAILFLIPVIITAALTSKNKATLNSKTLSDTIAMPAKITKTYKLRTQADTSKIKGIITLDESSKALSVLFD